MTDPQTWIDETDIGYDYVKPNGFRMSFHNLPKVSYFCQTANIPGFTMNPAMFPTPFHDLPISGDKGAFEQLRITFIIDAELRNFIELRNWITGIAFPDSNQQFIDLRNSGVNKPLFKLNKFNEETGLYTDATLVVLTGKNNPYALLSFNDIFPIAISGMDFASTIGDIQYLVASATFEYKTYTVEIL